MNKITQAVPKTAVRRAQSTSRCLPTCSGGNPDQPFLEVGVFSPSQQHLRDHHPWKTHSFLTG